MLSIAVTGGPSSGKTTVIDKIVRELRQFGYNVIVSPEMATITINSGILPAGDNAIDAVKFQKIILKRQLIFEETCLLAAEELGDNTVILFDRGTLDGYAYVDKDKWESVLESQNQKTLNLLSNYDAVIYLEGKEDFFTTKNNEARYEKSADEAKLKGEKVLQSYLSHDNLIIVKAQERFEDKQKNVLNIVENLLGNPTSLKEQRKFLVTDVAVDKLNTIASKVVITQDYLKEENGCEYRLRKIERDGDATYHYCQQKKKENGIREVIKSSTIDEEEYKHLLQTKSSEFATCVKTRYSFVYNRQYFRLDIFPDNLMILEVNVTKENPEVSLPEFINAIEEVTNEERYQNINIARSKQQEYGKRKINSN